MNRQENPRPVILTFVRYYLPGYKAGGPLRTVSNMVEALGAEFDFRIVTSDRDATDTAPYPDIVEGAWRKVGKARVLYLSPARKGLLHIASILSGTPHDILYLNSFFDPVFTQKPLIARRLGLAPTVRCVLAPRGEFSEGALALKSGKKKGFFLAARAGGLYRDLEWHASSAHEEADIRRTLGSLAGRIKVAFNLPGTTVRPPPFRSRNPGEPLRMVFLSRISPKKNLDFALEVLRHVRAPVRFDIYGTIDDEAYWTKCQKIMATLPNNVEAAWLGSIPHALVTETLAQYDLFFLATRGENYGHAIFEALSVGTPVLIADTTPWRGLEEKGIGWDLPLKNPEDFAACIGKVFAFDVQEQARRRRLIAAFADERRESEASVAQNFSLFAPCKRHVAEAGYH